MSSPFWYDSASRRAYACAGTAPWSVSRGTGGSTGPGAGGWWTDGALSVSLYQEEVLPPDSGRRPACGGEGAGGGLGDSLSVLVVSDLISIKQNTRRYRRSTTHYTSTHFTALPCNFFSSIPKEVRLWPPSLFKRSQHGTVEANKS